MPTAFWHQKKHPAYALTLLTALLVLTPLAVVLSAFASPQAAIWAHLQRYVLPDLLLNTLWLLLGVGLGAGLLGISLAWLTAVCDFPGRHFFTWALMLPLAMPSYVLAFVSIGFLDYTGPLQTLWRELTGSTAAWPAIRSRAGVIAVMTLALYPYVYLLMRNAFLTQGQRALEVGQSLGWDRWRGFFKIALPMARPWLAGGLVLVMMEVLADFGTVAVFNYDTFTTAIYKAWFGLFSLASASQLASLLVLFVIVLLVLEQRQQRAKRYHAPGNSTTPRYQLKPGARWLACAYASVVVLLGFALPLGQLLVWSVNMLTESLDARYWQFIWHSVLLSTLAALLVVAVALALAYNARAHGDRFTALLTRFSTLGYALPGTVLAVGFFIPVAWLDNQWVKLFPDYSGPLLRGTLLVMLLAYLVRFLAPGFNAVESAMHRITRSQEETARSMGVAGTALIRRVYWPLMRGGLLSAALLVFVDVMKEMPITLMTRPFGWDTLAIRIFEMTSEGQWELAALPAVAIVLVGLLPVILLTRQGEPA